MVVHDVGEMIGWQLVGTLVEHLVVQDAAIDANLSANDVVHDDVAARLDEETDHILLAFCDERVHFFLAERQRVAHLHSCACIVLEVLYFSAFRIEFLGRIEGDVGLAAFEELLNILLVNVATLALAIRSVVATEAHTLVELDAEPFERLDDVLLGSGHKAARVGVVPLINCVALLSLKYLVI